MKNPTVLLLSVNSGYGHVRAGEILERSLRRRLPSNWEIKHENLCDYAPAFLGWCIERLWCAASTWPILRGIYGLLHRIVVSNDRIGEWYSLAYLPVGMRLAKAFANTDIRSVVALHPGAGCACVWWKKQRHFFLNIVATDFVVHSLQVLPEIDAIFASSGAVLASPRAKTEHLSGRILFTGLPIDSGFFEGNDRERREKGDPKTNSVVVTFGAKGLRAKPHISMLMNLVTELHPLSITFLCGHNKRLQGQLNKLVKKNGLTNRVQVLDFRHDVAEIVRSAELILGKAGGLTVGESMAAQKPFVAIEVFPGQEEYNARLLQSAEVGRIASNSIDLRRAVDEIIGKNIVVSTRARMKKIAGGGAEAIAEAISSKLLVEETTSETQMDDQTVTADAA